MSSEAFTIVYNKALDLVSRREHSRHELMQKLDQRYPETSSIIEEVLDKLEINKDIWSINGPEVVFASAPMHTRMTVIRL